MVVVTGGVPEVVVIVVNVKPGGQRARAEGSTLAAECRRWR